MLKKSFFVGATLIFGMAMFNACGSDSGTSAKDNEIPASSDTDLSSSSQVTEGFSSSLEAEVSSSSLNATSSSQGSATGAGKSSSSTETAMSSEKIDEPTSSSDSSPSESVSSSSEAVSSSSKKTAGISSAAVEGAYRSTQRVRYFTENGQNYYEYFKKYCEVDNGTYTLKEASAYSRVYAYTIENDTLKTFTANEDLTFQKDYADIYTGKNSDIWGTWVPSNCRISEGAMKCSEIDVAKTFEFQQDSIVFYMMPEKNYDYMEKQGQAYEYLLEIFGEKFYRYTESENRYVLEDVPSYGITFSNKKNNSVTATIQGQVVDFTYSAWSEPDHVIMEGSVTSNGKTCSRKTKFSYVTKETCNADYSHALEVDGRAGNTENHFTTSNVVDQGDVEAYNNCIEEMFKDNPIWELLKN